MPINSTEVSYGFGQLGSIYSTSGSDEIKPPTGKVFVAISFLTNTTFDDSTGLIAEQRTNKTTGGVQVTNNVYIGTNAAANDLDNATIDEGSGGKVIVGSTSSGSVTFPKGMTIYGRWTEIDIYQGEIIAYIGH
tara:strand:+ start:1519 stop:1920 length:402 start_codon:yes stop_codon:yes gene_type:complete